MAADLRSISTFERFSIIVMDDAVVKLEHTYGDDRLRRIMFASLESLIIWQKIAWSRLILFTILLLLPGILLAFLNEDLRILGYALAGVGILLILYYAYCGKTTIRMVRRGVVTEFGGFYRPGKVRKFRDKVLQGVQRVQASNPST